MAAWSPRRWSRTQQARPTQFASVERSSVMPWRASICACRYSGRESQNLLTTNRADHQDVERRQPP
jgi:hypothetical protein